MLNKYKETISKIEASEELKNTIIEKMKKEQAKRRGGIIVKIKKVISTVISLLGIMACGGVVFAAVSGMIKIGNRGIIFSDQYTEYEQKVENQYLEKDGTKVELVSTMCDDGFLVLQFEVELSDALSEGELGGMCYLSFNDEVLYDNNGYKYLNLAGANYNLIIDGEEYWLKGATDSQIIENIRNKNYTIYQLYFLPSDVVENKENFTITLDDVIIAKVPDAGEFFEMDGNFEIEVSKEKSLQNTTTIINENASVTYERLTNKIEKFSQTPMQTIIKVSSLLVDVTTRNTFISSRNDYIGDLTYKVYDQDNNELFTYNTVIGYEYYWEDGRIKTLSISEIGVGEEEFGYNKYIKKEYIVTEKSEQIKSLRVEVYEENQYYERIRQIGTHYINLEKEEIACENKNKIVKDEENLTPTIDEKKIEDNEYFDIKIDKKYDHELRSCYYAGYEHIVYEEIEDYRLNTELSEEDCDMIIYDVSLWNPEYMNQGFKIVLFKDKTLYDIYYREEDIISIPLESIVIEENDKYKLALFMSCGVGKIQNIKEIIDTIKLKEDTENTESDYIVLYNGQKIDKGIGTYDWGDGDEASRIDNTKVYYNYRNGKYIGETVGISFQGDDNDPKISISKKYDAIPRKYERVNEIPEKLDFLKKENVIKSEINKIDLDGDGKEEYICCYAMEYKTGDYSDMYKYELLKSHIEIFDSNFDKIGNLTHLESDSDVYLSLEEHVEYIDIDNDGIMEILIEVPGWEWITLEVFKYDNNQLSGNVDSYNHASWRHGA